MDEADYAQQNEAQLIEMRINRARRILNGPVNETIECIDCEEIIPEARRKAVPGCIRCIGCQSLFERLSGI